MLTIVKEQQDVDEETEIKCGRQIKGLVKTPRNSMLTPRKRKRKNTSTTVKKKKNKVVEPAISADVACEWILNHVEDAEKIIALIARVTKKRRAQAKRAHTIKMKPKKPKKPKRPKRPKRHIAGFSLTMIKSAPTGILDHSQLCDFKHDLGERKIEVEYDDPLHTYHIDGVKARSVTKVVGRVTGPYDVNAHADRKWLKLTEDERAMTTRARIKLQIDAHNETRRDEGSAIHDCFEKWLHKTPPDASQQVLFDEYTEVFIRIGEFLQTLGITVVATETILASRVLGVAGRFDLLGYHAESGAYVMMDLKTKRSEKGGLWWIMENGYPAKGGMGKMMLPAPFQYLPCGDRTKQSIQLRLYSELIHETFGVTVSKAFAIVIDCSTKEVAMVPAQDMDDVMNTIAPQLISEWKEIKDIFELSNVDPTMFDFDFDSSLTSD